MTGHRRSARAGVPTRQRCGSRHGRVAVSRPRSRARRGERDAACLSVACPARSRVEDPGNHTATGVRPRATSRHRAGESHPTSRRASPPERRSRPGGVVDRAVTRTRAAPHRRTRDRRRSLRFARPGRRAAARQGQEPRETVRPRRLLTRPAVRRHDRAGAGRRRHRSRRPRERDAGAGRRVRLREVDDRRDAAATARPDRRRRSAPHAGGRPGAAYGDHRRRWRRRPGRVRRPRRR